MSYSFPERLFPTHYSSGPPSRGSKHTAGGWGEYMGILNPAVQGVSSETYPRFVPRRQTRGEPWSPSEPLVLPLLPPKPIPLWHLDSSDSTDLGHHMGNFYLTHYCDAFSSVSGLLRDHLDLCPKKGQHTGAMNLGWAADFLGKLKYKKCEYTYLRDDVVAYDALLRDLIHDIPPALLGGLLSEELQLSSQRLQFSEAATGGALAHAALPQDTWLVYANGPAFNLLNFQRVSLRSEEAAAAWLDASSKPTCVELKGPVRQISCSTLLTDCCVAVRSDYQCGVWRCNEVDKPKVLEVIKTRQPATCITASPHVLGEVLLADESGSAHLWTVGKGKIQVRHEDSNLYFNACSPWRWCEFSAHPRVMVYADRTGMELTDTRAANASGFTLFRIGQSPRCRSGERVVLGRYLADAHPFHHLVTTQYSAYIMDERFPLLPMLKWDHMMQAPPIFAQVLQGQGSSSTKVVIGSQSSQEIIMLQYTGGSVESCVSMGPPQELLRPRDALDHLPVQLPHRTQDHHRRLALPAAGLACFPGGRGDGAGEDSICVLQLTEAGDVFSQVLRPGGPAAGPGGAGGSPQQSATAPQPDWGAEDTGSEDEVVGPTQPAGGLLAVPETPERADASSCDEEDQGWWSGRKLQYLGLEVVVNEEVGETATAQPDGAAAPGAPEDPTAAAAAASDWTDQAAPPSTRAAAAWRVWLQQLLRCRPACRPKPAGQKPMRTKVPGFRLSAARDPITEDCLQSLGRDLRESMASGSLLLHGATYLPHVALPALPDPVLPEAWPDSLSQRLTVSWQGGEEQWRTWWLEKLGLNNKERAEALRSRRRKEKAKRRSSSLNASGSLSSWGWSDSAASQRGWSDTDDALSRSTCWSEPGSPGSTVSQQQRSSPGVSLCRGSRQLSGGLAGSPPNPKEGSPQLAWLFDMEDDPEPPSFCSQQAAGGGACTPGALTPGRLTPGRLTPGALTPGALTPGRPTPGALTPGALTPGALTPGALTPGALTPGRLTPGALTPGRPTPGALTPGRLPPGRLPPGALTPGALTPGALTPGELTPGALTPGRPTPGALTLGPLTPGALTPGRLPPGALTPGALTPGALTPGRLTPGALTLGPLTPGRLPPGRLPPGRPTPGPLTLGRLPPGALTLGPLSPGRPTPGALTPGRLTPGRPTPGALTPGALTPGALTPGALTPGRLTPGRLPPGPLPPGPLPPGRPTPGRPTPGRPTPGRATPGASQSSQSSLGRPGSQSSQVKRKRSQMGF